jgi:hypothetical protein
MLGLGVGRSLQNGYERSTDGSKAESQDTPPHIKLQSKRQLMPPTTPTARPFPARRRLSRAVTPWATSQASPLRGDPRSGFSMCGSRCEPPCSPKFPTSAPQVSASALERGPGVGSLTPRVGLCWPAAPSCRPSSPQQGASRSGPDVQHHGFGLIVVPGVQLVATAEYRHCQPAPGFAWPHRAAQSCRHPSP